MIYIVFGIIIFMIYTNTTTSLPRTLLFQFCGHLFFYEHEDCGHIYIS
jgi:hypothetical protein